MEIWVSVINVMIYITLFTLIVRTYLTVRRVQREVRVLHDMIAHQDSLKLQTDRVIQEELLSLRAQRAYAEKQKESCENQLQAVKEDLGLSGGNAI